MKLINSLSEVNFSIEAAAEAGYKVRLDSDGCAEVSKPNGTAYHVHNFVCDCPDAIGRNGGSYQLPDGRHACKHVFLVAQARPCPWCGGTMVLEPEHKGERYFRCLVCKAAFDVRLVRQARREAFSGACGGVRTPGLPSEPQMADNDVDGLDSEQEAVLAEAAVVWDAEALRLADEDTLAGVEAARAALEEWNAPVPSAL